MKKKSEKERHFEENEMARKRKKNLRL